MLQARDEDVELSFTITMVLISVFLKAEKWSTERTTS